MKAETLEENYQALSELYSNMRKELERIHKENEDKERNKNPYETAEIGYWKAKNKLTEEKLDIAVGALKDFSIHPDDSVKKYAKKILEQITAEQKDVK